MLNKAGVVEVVKEQLWPGYIKARDRARVVDSWLRNQQPNVVAPRGATAELKALLELAKTPWLGHVVTIISQELYADGFRSPNQTDKDNNPAWATWEANDLDARQTPIYRSAEGYGTAYVTVTPGADSDGPRSVIRGSSPLKTFALYQDPAEDDWPMYGIQVRPQGGSVAAVRYLDEESIWELSTTDNGATFDAIEPSGHDAGVCPIVRYCPDLDLEGRSEGVVEPLIGVAKRIDKTTYDRLLTQHFTGWRIITVAGMEQPSDQEAKNRAKLQIRHDDVLIADDPDTKFNVLQPSPMGDILQAGKDDVATLSALSQLPITAFNGSVSNVSADALELLRSGLTALLVSHKKSFGKSNAQALRLAAQLEGRDEEARDMASRITWQDTSVRSIAQAADALGKFATMLGVPPQALWSRIPGVEVADIVEWKAAAAKMPAAQPGSFAAMADALARGTTPPPA